jgi:hypothetical protein
MYQHNVDALLYGVFFYLMLTFAANSYLWVLTSNTAHACP